MHYLLSTRDCKWQHIHPPRELCRIKTWTVLKTFFFFFFFPLIFQDFCIWTNSENSKQPAIPWKFRRLVIMISFKSWHTPTGNGPLVRWKLCKNGICLQFVGNVCTLHIWGFWSWIRSRTLLQNIVFSDQMFDLTSLYSFPGPTDISFHCKNERKTLHLCFIYREK